MTIRQAPRRIAVRIGGHLLAAIALVGAAGRTGRKWPVRMAMASLVVGVIAIPVTATGAHAAGTQASAIAEPASSAPYAYLENYRSHKCIEDPGYSTQAGRQLDQWTCNGGTNQLWRLYSTGTAQDEYIFINEYSRQCINVRGYSKSNGAAIQQWPCTAADATTNELWYADVFVGNINGLSYYMWADSGSNMCLNVLGNSTANGTGIIQYNCILQNAQNEWFASPYAS